MQCCVIMGLQDVFVKQECFCNGHILKIVALIFCLELGTKQKRLLQGIQMRIMKDLSFTIQKLLSMFKIFADKQTGQKLYAPDLSMRGKNTYKQYPYISELMSLCINFETFL